MSRLANTRVACVSVIHGPPDRQSGCEPRTLATWAHTRRSKPRSSKREHSTALLTSSEIHAFPMPFVTRQSDALSHSSVLIVNGDRDICSTFTNKLKAKGYEVGSVLDESVLKTVIL